MANEGQNSGLGKLAKFFGKKEGQNLAEFSKEIAQLTDEDKAQLIEGIENGTLTY